VQAAYLPPAHTIQIHKENMPISNLNTNTGVFPINHIDTVHTFKCTGENGKTTLLSFQFAVYFTTTTNTMSIAPYNIIRFIRFTKEPATPGKSGARQQAPLCLIKKTLPISIPIISKNYTRY